MDSDAKNRNATQTAQLALKACQLTRSHRTIMVGTPVPRLTPRRGQRKPLRRFLFFSGAQSPRCDGDGQ